MDIDTSNPDRDREIALELCAEAAVVWYEPEATGEKRIDAVRLAWAWVASVLRYDGKQPPREHDEFMSLLERPVEEWLGVPAIEGPLVKVGAATPLALDIVALTGGANPEIEKIQALIGEIKKTLEAREDGEKEYRKIRRFVIDHATATVDEAQIALVAARRAPQDLFEKIPPSYTKFIGPTEVFYPCPRCKWPLRLLKDPVQCESEICRLEGAVFEKKRGRFTALAEKEPPEPVPVNGRLRLQPVFWRFTLQPGLVEKDLELRLKRTPGVKVTLWPFVDRFDLRVKAGQKSWDVDVKDWIAHWKLAKNLREKHTTKGMYIVVPDWRSHQINILDDRCGDLGLHFFTVTMFVTMVKSAMNRKGGRCEKSR